MCNKTKLNQNTMKHIFNEAIKQELLKTLFGTGKIKRP